MFGIADPGGEAWAWHSGEDERCCLEGFVRKVDTESWVKWVV